MQPHQERVVTEQKELQDKLDKLRAFISKPKPPFCSFDEWNRLRQQHEAMCQYNDILLARIDNF